MDLHSYLISISYGDNSHRLTELRIGIDGHGLAPKLPQICPTKLDRIPGHSQSCANVSFKRLRGTALDCDNVRWVSKQMKVSYLGWYCR